MREKNFRKQRKRDFAKSKQYGSKKKAGKEILNIGVLGKTEWLKKTT